MSIESVGEKKSGNTSDGVPSILVGTRRGLYEAGEELRTLVDGHSIRALSHNGGDIWAIVDGWHLWRGNKNGDWEEVATTDENPLTCVLPAESGLLIGTAEAHLLRLDGDELVTLESFENAPGREDWHTPWGGPPATRSISQDQARNIYVNVHVGGILKSEDEGNSWKPTVDIGVDVHQVFAGSKHPGLVLGAAAAGVGISTDYGDSWTFETDGFHETYSRAVTFSDDVILATVSEGHRGGRAAVYRKLIGESKPFERCRSGLPEWFSDNIDTGCLDALGAYAVFGTQDGHVFLSRNKGETWNHITSDLPPVNCTVIW